MLKNKKSYLFSHSHLDAIQGASEEQTELYIEILRRSTAACNAVARQKLPVQPAVLVGKAVVRRAE
jgi:hypothetical protein